MPLKHSKGAKKDRTQDVIACMEWLLERPDLNIDQVYQRATELFGWEITFEAGKAILRGIDRWEQSKVTH